MKYILISFFSLFLVSCVDLDMNPLAEASSETWYSTEKEVRKSLNDLYRNVFWPTIPPFYTDDYMAREVLSPIQNGTMTGQWGVSINLWKNSYKAIARVNTILENLDAKGSSLGLTQTQLDQFYGEAKFFLAAFYSTLVFRYGDVVWLDKTIDIDEAFQIGRTPKNEVIPLIYGAYDDAIKKLPVEYAGVKYATKGAALALKARFALYMEDWEIASSAASECMKLGYSLHPSYATLFLQSTKTSPEFVFDLPRSVEYNVTWSPTRDLNVRAALPRNSGGFAGDHPSWSLLASYLCTDGLPIDESPLFDPSDPYKNRDPRCAMTCVVPGEMWFGVAYNPHPDALTTTNDKGETIKNEDCRSVNQYASYNGMLLKKGVDASWEENGYMIAPNNIVIRYADVLLIYAEAKIEAGDIDQSVLDAINTVRARAYGVQKDDTDNYPSVTTMDQAALRTILRTERRMEFAFEGAPRFDDLMRWHLGDVLSKYNYGIKYPTTDLDRSKWMWPYAPEIDENGIADFDKMFEEGYISMFVKPTWDDKQYLWPLPATDVAINNNIKQNPGY